MKDIIWGVCTVTLGICLQCDNILVGKDGETLSNVSLLSADGTTKELSPLKTFSFSLRASVNKIPYFFDFKAETKQPVGTSVTLRFKIKFMIADSTNLQYEEVVQSRTFVLVSQKKGSCSKL